MSAAQLPDTHTQWRNRLGQAAAAAKRSHRTWTLQRTQLWMAVVVAASVQTWFRPGRFVAAGDIRPFVLSFDGMAQLWGDSFSGTGSTGYPSASLLDTAVYAFVTGTGLSATFAQRVFYTLLVTSTALAVSYLTAAFTRNPAATAAAGLVSVFNPFHITQLPNPLPMMMIICVSLVVGVAARYVAGQRVHPAWGAFLALPAASLSRNPPLLALFAAISVAAIAWIWLTRSPGRGWSLGFVLCFAAGSLFWAVPLALHFGTGTPGLEVVAETNVGSWAWAQRNSSPLNVMTLGATWSWGNPDVLPATVQLTRFPWSLMRFGLPLAAAASVLLARRRVAYVIGSACLALIVLCVGVNAPFGPINRFLYDHVPGFWLFRQPMSKFGILLVIGYALLIALGIEGFSQKNPWRAMWGWKLRTVAASAAVCALAALAFAHPMYVGTVIPGQRTTLPPARVAVPDSFFAAGRWLDRAPGDGSVLVLPLSDYYQRGTTWGYYGTDDLLSKVTDRRTLFLLPGGYVEAAGSAPELMRSAETALLAGDREGLTNTLKALGVGYVAVRTDYTDLGRRRTFADGAALLRAASVTDALEPGAQFEHVSIFSVPLVAEVDTATSVFDVDPSLPDERLADIVAASGGAAIVPDDGADGHAVAWLPGSSERTFEFPNASGSYVAAARPRLPLTWSVSVSKVSTGFKLTTVLESTMTVDGASIMYVAPVETFTRARPVALVVDGATIGLEEGSTVFEAPPGPVKVLVETSRSTLSDADLTKLGNCNNTDGRTLEQSGITAVLDDDSASVTLTAQDGSACLPLQAPEATTSDGAELWQVSASFDRVGATRTRLCLWLPGPGTCAAGSPPATDEATGTFSFLAGSAGTATDRARLILYADAAYGADVVVIWSDVSVSTVGHAGDQIVIPMVSTAYRKATMIKGTAALGANPALLADVLAYVNPDAGDCNANDDRPFETLGISARSLPGESSQAFEISAGAHSGCVYGKLRVAPGVRHLTVSFEHRVLSGRPARWCLALPGGAGCLASGTLPSTAEWAPFSTEVKLPPSDPTEYSSAAPYRLFFYADGPFGDTDEKTVVQYRAASVRPSYALVGVAYPAPASRGTAEILQAGSSHVLNGTGRYLVIQRQAFADGWTAHGLPAGADHVVVDGWADGWLVDTDTATRSVVGFRYGYDAVVRLAVWSLVPVLLGALTLLVRSRHAARVRLTRRSDAQSPVI